MKKKKLDTRFEIWLRKLGPSKVGEMLDVHHSTTLHWLDGSVLPRALLMREIKRLTKGKIDYKHIIEGSLSPLNR